jgi:hypothetical protein
MTPRTCIISKNIYLYIYFMVVWSKFPRHNSITTLFPLLLSCCIIYSLSLLWLFLLSSATQTSSIRTPAYNLYIYCYFFLLIHLNICVTYMQREICYDSFEVLVSLNLLPLPLLITSELDAWPASNTLNCRYFIHFPTNY